MSYINDRIDYYISKLLDLNYYVARRTDVSGVSTAYLISAGDWRHTVIISGGSKNAFRLSILYVDSDNSYSYTENEFEDLLDKICLKKVVNLY
jgi:hypothetical protein